MRFLGFAAAVLGVASFVFPSARAAQNKERTAAVIHAIKAARPNHTLRILPTAAASMPACRSPLHVTWVTHHGASRTVAVRCPHPSWTLYTTVIQRTEKTVLVAKRLIKAGAPITRSEVTTETVPGSKVIGQPIEASFLSDGLRADGAIHPGQVLSRSNTAVPVAVRAGTHVRLVATTKGGVTISARGVTLQNGALGQRIEVENAASHKRLHARVVRTVPAHAGLFLVLPAKSRSGGS